MLPAIKLRQLEVFVTLADLGQVTRTARALAVTQPAVSMALAELERQVGPLFEREKGRLVLNAEGRERLPKAREILLRMRDFADLGEAESLQGTLRVGASNSVGNYYVADLLGDFMRTHPDVSLHMEVASTQTIVDRLLNHALDLACVEGPAHDGRIEALPWRDDELVVCAAPDHPLARRASLRAADFAGVAWVLREPGSATRHQAEALLAVLPEGHIVLELGQIEGIRQAVMANLGMSVLPRVAVEADAAAGRMCVLSVPHTPIVRHLSLLLPKAPYHGRMVDAFVQTVLG